MRWWFSGKIHRCQNSEFRPEIDSMGPGFDSRPTQFVSLLLPFPLLMVLDFWSIVYLLCVDFVLYVGSK